MRSEEVRAIFNAKKTRSKKINKNKLKIKKGIIEVRGPVCGTVFNLRGAVSLKLVVFLSF